MDSRRMDSGSSAFRSLARSSSYSSKNSDEMTAISGGHFGSSSRGYASSSSSAAGAGGSKGNMPQRCGSRIQTRIPGVSVHSCVVRLRAEDQHLAEDIIEGLEFARDRAVMSQLASHVNEILLTSPKRSNPSPLGSSSRGTSPMVMLQC
ncbi:hypothetical protein MARPO_0010s0164 [Marchantia polymorpha]|nr:hypothetical protein MARPO_0010s0164 [Marchantia polymorpha]|eukprot:PTQ46788.1 hypothetical protein MARPO_0010s0164 [Marchantia polymorpha]